MKHLVFALLLVIVGCGKDNKSGDVSAPIVLNPITTPHQEFLVGHWVEKDRCTSQRGRNSYIRERFEMRFYPTHTHSDSMAMGRVAFGGVEYSGRCESNSRLSQLPKAEDYMVSAEGLRLRSNRGRLMKFDVNIISQDIIEFKGKTLVRISSDPRS